MSLFENSNSSDYNLLKQHPSGPDEGENNVASSPSFNFGATNNNIRFSNNAEIVVTDDTNNSNNNQNHCTNPGNNDNFHHGYFGNAAGGGGSYIFNNIHNIHHHQNDAMLGNIHANNSNNNINPDIIDNSMEEELQLVPDSLDHLSRDELCRMIYRLDYERNTLRDQLEALSNQLRAKRNYDYYDNDHGRKKRKKRPRGGGGSSSDPGPDDMAQQLLQLQHEQLIAQGLQKSQLSGEIHGDDDEKATFVTRPTPAEIETVQKRLGQTIIEAIKSTAVHGGRKVPKTTVAESNLVEAIVSSMMQNHEGKKTSDTKRMKKWNLTYDRDIAELLKVSERLIHPVRHDGTGYIVPSGSRHCNGYHWARFVGLEVKHDRREMKLTLVARTVEAGRSGRPDRLVEKARYSRGEREDFPG